MISKSNVKFTGDVAWVVKSLLQHYEFLLIFFETMYNKTIIVSMDVLELHVYKKSVGSLAGSFCLELNAFPPKKLAC